MTDLRYAVRSLLRTPAFTAIAVVSLAIGMAANTTVVSLIDAIHFRPLGFPDPDRLVDVSETSMTRLCAGCGVGTSYPGYLDWRDAARSFSSMATYGEMDFALSDDVAAQRVRGGVVSSAFFSVVGFAPALGREFRPEDDQPGAERVVLLGHTLWLRRYQADSGILGRAIKLNGDIHTVIGVMPPASRFPGDARLWVTLGPRQPSSDRDRRDIGVVARLASGVTLEQANAEMRVIAKGLEARYPETQKEWSAAVVLLRDDLARDGAAAFWVLFGAVTFVLLIACANLASLFLARASGRTREIAVRAAVGASRWRIMRQLITESVVVSLAGGALGLLIAAASLHLALAALPAMVPGWIELRIDARIAAFCAVVSLGTGVLVGGVPAWRASRPDLIVPLQDGAASVSGGVRKTRLRSGLVVAEMALALVLLSGAGLLIKTFLRRSAPIAAAPAANVLFSELGMLDRRYDDSSATGAALEGIIERLEGKPGLRAAASRWVFIAGFGASDESISAEGLEQVPAGLSPRFAAAVTPRFFDVMDIPVVRGRGFTAADRIGALPVVIINAALAEQLWPGEPALGKRIRLGGASSGRPWSTVVGIIADGTAGGIAARAPSQAFVPFAQFPGQGIRLAVGTPESPLAAVDRVRTAVSAFDPGLLLEDFRSAEQDRLRVNWPLRFFAVVFGSFALFAVLLAAMGTYGVLAYVVSQRAREMGIRFALGAQPRDVIGLVVGRGVRLGATGVLIGVAGSVALAPAFRSVLFGADPVDPLVLMLVALLFGAVTVLASYLPARRAAAVDPIRVLRVE